MIKEGLEVKKRKMRNCSLTFLILLFLIACVSKKKHEEGLSQLESLHLQELASRDSMNQHLTLEKEKWYKEALLSKGSNQALSGMHNTLLNRIDSLRDEISMLGNQSKSSQADLLNTITEKEKKIAELRNLIDLVEKTLDQHINITEAFKQEMLLVLAQSDFENITMKSEEESFTLVIPTDELIDPKVIGRIRETGSTLLMKFVTVTERFPQMEYYVIGHTDNKRPPNRSYKNNWSYSCAVAARVVRALTEDFGLSPNQVTAGAKGEFEPRSSNEAQDGRIRNNRVEIHAIPVSESLQRNINSLLRENGWQKD